VPISTFNCPDCKSGTLIFVGKEIKPVQYPKIPWKWVIKGDAECNNCGASYYAEIDVRVETGTAKCDNCEIEYSTRME